MNHKLVTLIFLFSISIGKYAFGQTVATTPANSYGYLSVEANYDGASIFANDDSIGVSPLSDFKLQTGNYSIKVTFKNYGLWIEDITVSENKFIVLQPMLVFTKRIKFLTDVGGAEIYLNNKKVTENTFFNDSIGRYQLTISKSNYATITREIIITSTMTDNHIFAYTMIPQTFNVKLSTSPSGGIIEVKGQTIPSGQLLSLQYGKYKVTATREKFFSATKIITVNKSATKFQLHLYSRKTISLAFVGSTAKSGINKNTFYGATAGSTIHHFGFTLAYLFIGKTDYYYPSTTIFKTPNYIDIFEGDLISKYKFSSTKNDAASGSLTVGFVINKPFQYSINGGVGFIKENSFQQIYTAGNGHTGTGIATGDYFVTNEIRKGSLYKTIVAGVDFHPYKHLDISTFYATDLNSCFTFNLGIGYLFYSL